MSRTLIVITDGAHARFFLHEGPGMGLKPLSAEEMNADVPAGRDIMADRPGRSFSSVSEGRSAMEPKSDPRELVEKAFVSSVLERAEKLFAGQDAARIVIAADPGAVQAAIPTLTTGRLYDTFHNDRAERVAIIGRAAATQLGITRVDNQPAIFIGDTAYTLVGILDDVKRNPDLLLAVTIPTTAAVRDFPVAGANYQVLIATTAGAAQLAGHQAPIALRPDQPQRLQALVPPDPTTLRNQISSDITSLFLALSTLALLIGTIAIANATLLNIIERRSEIGLRRALGARRAHIRRQITTETALTGTTAALLGTSLAITTCAIYTHTRGWTLTINPTTLIIAPIIGLTTGTIAGLLPAIRAARTPPADTLRT